MDVLIRGIGITGESNRKDKIGSIPHSIPQNKFTMGLTFNIRIIL